MGIEGAAQLLQGDGTVEGARIVEVGKSPWQIENTRAMATLRHKAMSKATVLDPNSMPTGEDTVERADDGVKIACPATPCMCVCAVKAREERRRCA